jgi:L-aspartate oxidase
VSANVFGRYLTDFNVEKLDKEVTDYIVVGSGIAGLYTALKLSEHGKVLIFTKRGLCESNTYHAQGGIAAALGEEDTKDLHFQDTMKAGAGLCNPTAVRVLVDEGPDRVRELIDLGVGFDRDKGAIALTKEGAHSLSRVLHAHGDATGRELVHSLGRNVLDNSNITVYEHTQVIDILTDERGACIGLLCIDTKTKRLRIVLGSATVIATGGAGRMYANTSNPIGATGDGYALCYRAGAELADMEFVQFHPTVFCPDNDECFLISESVRGEGGILRNIHGETFMHRYDERGELAPRDIVARAILEEMKNTSAKHVFLDVTHFPLEKLMRRFPTIYSTCKKHGLDVLQEYIPVLPAAHYMMGGVRTDLYGRTTVEHLYACGEVASTGVHGGNRLASNSLLEAVVFAKRIADDIAKYKDTNTVCLKDLSGRSLLRRRPIGRKEVDYCLARLQSIMSENVGIVRTIRGLESARAQIEELAKSIWVQSSDLTVLELQNIATTAYIVVLSALERRESRGSHYCSDFPELRNDVSDVHTVKKRGEQEFESFCIG